MSEIEELTKKMGEIEELISDEIGIEVSDEITSLMNACKTFEKLKVDLGDEEEAHFYISERKDIYLQISSAYGRVFFSLGKANKLRKFLNEHLGENG